VPELPGRVIRLMLRAILDGWLAAGRRGLLLQERRTRGELRKLFGRRVTAQQAVIVVQRRVVAVNTSEARIHADYCGLLRLSQPTLTVV